MDILITNIKFNIQKLYLDNSLIEEFIQSIEVNFNINHEIESKVNIETNKYLELKEIEEHIRLKIFGEKEISER